MSAPAIFVVGPEGSGTTLLATCIARHPALADREFWIAPPRDRPIPDHVSNKAPLLSAHRDHWEAIGGYDPHRLFSTGYTLFGRDVARRFKLLLGDAERTISVAGVHPWHPTEMQRRSDPFRILFDVQSEAIAWSARRRLFDVRARREASNALYAAHAEAIDRAIARAEAEMRQSTRPAG